MQPYAENVVTFRVMLGGYEQSLQRYAAARVTRDPALVFAPLFEALNWSVAMDDQARENWTPGGDRLGWEWRDRVPNGEVVDAVRLARNRVHHQWADALTLTEGFAIPMTFPLAMHEWTWRPLSDLPPGDPPKSRKTQIILAASEAVYEQLLARQPARFALDQLRGAFEYVADRLEPLGPNPTTQ